MTPNKVTAKFSLVFRFINSKQHKNLINSSEGKETSLNTDFYRVVILLLKAVYVFNYWAFNDWDNSALTAHSSVLFIGWKQYTS